PMAMLELRPGRDDPYTIYERLRARGPLSTTRLGNLLTTDHAICRTVLKSRSFVVRMPDAPPPAADEPDLSFLEMNPPDHTRLRRRAMPAFSPRKLAEYRPRIEATIDRLLDRAPARFDLVAALAAPLPISVITDLLGIPDADAERFSRYGTALGSA